MPVRLDADAYARLIEDADVPSVGRAIAGNEVEILRADGTAADPGEAGEIVVRGHNVMLGYLGDREANDDAFRGGWLRTGDLGRKVCDPSIVEPVFVVTGRAKNVVKVSGQTIGIEEVERELARLGGVAAAAALGIRDERSEEALAVLIVRASKHLDEKAVRTAMRTRLGPSLVPKVVRFVDALPLLSNGKLARQRLPELVQAD
jgi:acyl-CoA synthetase (AMP-forming)/AMP-acid ligase II